MKLSVKTLNFISSTTHKNASASKVLLDHCEGVLARSEYVGRGLRNSDPSDGISNYVCIFILKQIEVSQQINSMKLLNTKKVLCKENVYNHIIGAYMQILKSHSQPIYIYKNNKWNQRIKSINEKETKQLLKCGDFGDRDRGIE